MAQKDNDNLFVHVEDASGNHFYCPLDFINAKPLLANDDLVECVEEGAVNRYAGHVIVQSRIRLKTGSGNN